MVWWWKQPCRFDPLFCLFDIKQNEHSVAYISTTVHTLHFFHGLPLFKHGSCKNVNMGRDKHVRQIHDQAYVYLDGHASCVHEDCLHYFMRLPRRAATLLRRSETGYEFYGPERREDSDRPWWASNSKLGNSGSATKEYGKLGSRVICSAD